MHLVLDSITVVAAGRRLLTNVSLEVPSGEVLALVGESGSGKTTLLRCCNGLVAPSGGTVRYDGTVLRGDHVAMRRRIGYVPQHGGLMPHWTVGRNVELVPALLADPRATSLAREALALCGLEPDEFTPRYPHQLSGGQRQRVALARALAARQPALLLDEPFSALDAVSREEVVQTLIDAQRAVGCTTVLVTHDLGEAVRTGDRVAVLRAGQLEHIGSPAELLASPATPYVAALVAQARAASRALEERS